MINREYQKVNILTYNSETDEYGQVRQDTPTKTVIDMVCKVYTQTNTNDMRYVDVELIGLTKCNSITNKNEIEINDVIYTVMYVVPSRTYYQILMKKK